MGLRSASSKTRWSCLLIRTGSRISIHATDDPGEALAAARRARPKNAPPMLVAAFWAHSLRAAPQIAVLALANDLRGVGRDGNGRMSIDVVTATAAIRGAAARMEIGVAPRCNAAGTLMMSGRSIVYALGDRLPC